MDWVLQIMILMWKYKKIIEINSIILRDGRIIGPQNESRNEFHGRSIGSNPQHKTPHGKIIGSNPAVPAVFSLYFHLKSL